MGSVALLAAAGSENLSIFAPTSPPADAIRSLSFMIFAITGLIFLIVEAVLFYSVFRFRRLETAPATEPPQVYGSKPIEIAWTAAPTLVVFLLVLVLARTLWEVKKTPPTPKEKDGTLFVTVIGRQWWWEYIYDHYDGRPLGFATANELHVPVSAEGQPRPVYLTLKSADVSHSFWVPRLAGKTDLIPGRVNHMWFETDQPGLYFGQCAEYCGTQHAKMLLRVIAEPSADFQLWLEAESKPSLDEPAVAEGKSAFMAQSCVNCHRVRGTGATGTYAPDLTHLMARKTLAAGIMPNTPDMLRRWVHDPQQDKPGCLMPAFKLDDRERDLIVGYLLSLQ